MNDLHDGRTRDEEPPTSVESSLAAIIDRYGPALLYEPERLRLLLGQDFPANDAQIAHLLAALVAEVPQRLLAAHGDESLHTLLPKLADRLGSDPAFDRVTARWTVRAWATALALPTAGLDAKAKARTARVGTAAPAPPSFSPASFASVVTPLSTGRPTAPAPTPAATAMSATTPGPAPTASPRPIAGSSAHDASLQRVLPIGDAPAEALAEAVPAEPAIEPSATIEPTPPIDPVPAPPVETPAVAPVETPLDTPVEPPAATPTVAPDAAPPPPRKSSWFAERPPADPSSALPAWAREALDDEPLPDAPVPGADTPRSNFRLIVAASVALAVLVIGAILYLAFRPSRFEFTDAAIRPPASAATGAAPAPTSTNDRTSGAAPPAPSATTAPVPTAAQAASTPVVAAPAQPDLARPAPPAAAQAPTPPAPKTPAITRIELPRIVAGKPFTMGVTASSPAADLATIERRAVDAAGRVDPTPTVTPVGGLKRTRSGGLLVPFAAIDAPSQTTVEVTVVDRAGGRSPPRRVDLRATAAPAAATAPPATRAAPPSKNAAAKSASETKAAATPKAPAPAPAKAAVVGCTRSTCGSVVSVRPVDAGWSAFEVIVRLDDRTIQATRQAARWRVGSRVRIVGGRLQQLPT